MFSEHVMTCDSEMVTFKSHVNSAMGNQIPWNVLVTLMKEICSTFEKSLAVNDVLLDELKTFKSSDIEPDIKKTDENIPIDAFDDTNHSKSEITVEPDNPVDIKKESGEDLSLDLKDEPYFEDQEDLNDEDYYDPLMEYENQNDDFDEDAEEEDVQDDANSYQCETCNKKFKHKQSLYKHRKKKHGEPSQKSKNR